VIALAPQNDAAEAIGVFIGVIVVYGVFGVICAVMAPGRGRSAVAWFFIGVATQCLGIILLLLLPNLKLEEQKQRRHDEETRRLREQLKKERQVADDRHATHRARIDVHDRALGVDTSAAESPPLLSGAPPPLPAPAEPTWFYALGGQQAGPVTAADLRGLLRDGTLDAASLVWREGLAEWTPIGKVAAEIGDLPA